MIQIENKDFLFLKPLFVGESRESYKPLKLYVDWIFSCNV